MFEVTREMLDAAIEEERRNKNEFNDSVNKFILSYMITFAVISMIILFFVPVGFGTKFLLLLGAVVVYVIIGILATLILTAKYVRIMEIADVAKSIIGNKKKKEIAKSDSKTRINWLTAKLSAAKSNKDKIFIINELMPVYATECMDDKVDECFDMIKLLDPQKDLEKVIKLDTLLYYYDYKDDTENYIRTYNDNEDILQQWWAMPLTMKFSLFNRYRSFLFIMGDYQKALEFYNLNLEIHEKAAEIDVDFALPEESKNLYCIDYAMLYCKLGEKEKAAESFRVALERNSNTDKPYIKKHIEKVRGMLNEAGVNYSTAT